MTGKPPLSSRAAAWSVLRQYDIANHDASELLDSVLDRTDRPGQTTDIVLGVIRHRRTLDFILKKCASVEPNRVKEGLWNLLRIGVYELVFAPKTAAYAILNEAVELAQKRHSQKTAGFVNAVLRNVQRAMEARQADLTARNARRLIPQTADSGGLFNMDLLPDPDSSPAEYFGLGFSLPTPLITQWLAAFGAEQTRRICLGSNRSPSVIIQPNTLLTTPPELSERLNHENADIEIQNDVLAMRKSGRLNRLESYRDGFFYVQDTTAAAAVRLLAPDPDWTIADLCSAPGGKCIALALLQKDQGTILAGDINAERLKKVRLNAARMRLESIEIVPAGRIESVLKKAKRLDAIILDAPCSNTGVLARRVEARWRWTPEATAGLCRIQRDLLNKAAAMARKRTRILYSTCSIQPEENQQQIQQFLSENKPFTLLKEKLTLPSVQTENALDHDGGYAAVLQM